MKKKFYNRKLFNVLTTFLADIYFRLALGVREKSFEKEAGKADLFLKQEIVRERKEGKEKGEPE